jgi:hypothetical protein
LIPCAIALGVSACVLAPEADPAGGIAAAADGKDKGGAGTATDATQDRRMRRLFGKEWMRHVLGKERTRRVFVTNRVALEIEPAEGDVLAHLSNHNLRDDVRLKWVDDQTLSDNSRPPALLRLSKDGRLVDHVDWYNGRWQHYDFVNEDLRGSEVAPVPQGPFGSLLGGYLGKTVIEVGSRGGPTASLYLTGYGAYVSVDFVEGPPGYYQIRLLAPTRIASNGAKTTWSIVPKEFWPRDAAGRYHGTHAGTYDPTKHEVTLSATDDGHRLLSLTLKLNNDETKVSAVHWKQEYSSEQHGTVDASKDASKRTQ